jgi:hypothetical protein
MNIDNKNLITLVNSYKITIDKFRSQMSHNKNIMEQLNKTLEEKLKDVEFKNRYIEELKNDVKERDLEIFKLKEDNTSLNLQLDTYKNRPYKKTIIFNDNNTRTEINN